MPAKDQKYSWETSPLLEHYFPGGKALPNSIVAGGSLLTPKDASLLATTLAQIPRDEFDRLIMQLTIPIPQEHAVFLGIDFTNHTITYQDPYGRGMDEKETHLRPILGKTLPEFTIVEPRYPQQIDHCSCVPITIHNMVEYARSGMLPKNVDIDAIRKEHNSILDNMRQQRINSAGAAIGFKLRREISARDPHFNQGIVPLALHALKENMRGSGVYMAGKYEMAFVNFSSELSTAGQKFICAIADYLTSNSGKSLGLKKLKRDFSKMADAAIPPLQALKPNI